MARNLYFSNAQAHDLNKFREDAAKRARGDIRNPPEEVIIHMHAHGVDCKGQEHEVSHVESASDE